MKSKLKINQEDHDTYTTCILCNQKFIRITPTHLKHKHLISLKQYIESYGIESITSKILRDSASVTEKALQIKYGDSEGSMKWKEYCHKQSVTNTFEYKQKKYGWTLEQFKEYNKSRAVTKANFIKRYGEADGCAKWNEYCDLQRYVGIKLEYFIEKYGQIDGQEKYNMMLLAKIKSSKSPHSKISQDLFNKIEQQIEKYDHCTFYALKNKEYCLINNKNFFSLDYFNLTTKKAIEFFGDYWHANPQIYKEANKIFRANKTVKEQWDQDAKRLNIIKEKYNIDVLVIWEKEYKSDPETIIKQCIDFLTC